MREHHLRQWYALADLYDRSGDVPQARRLFREVLANQPGFADAEERLAALGAEPRAAGPATPRQRRLGEAPDLL